MSAAKGESAVCDRLLNAARLTLYLSAAMLAVSYIGLVAWARNASQPLGSVQNGSHAVAAALHAAALANVTLGSAQPRLIGINLLAFAVVLAVLPGGAFHVMFWPESFFVGAAGALCCFAPARPSI